MKVKLFISHNFCAFIHRKADHGSFEDMRRLFNATFDADSAIIARMQTQPLEAIASEEITVKIDTGHDAILPIAAFLGSHLAPYFPNKDDPLLPEYQTPGIDAPEPDDPFDEVYSVMTMREKRRKLQGDFFPGRGDESAFEPRCQKISVSLAKLIDLIGLIPSVASIFLCADLFK